MRFSYTFQLQTITKCSDINAMRTSPSFEHFEITACHRSALVIIPNRRLMMFCGLDMCEVLRMSPLAVEAK